MIDRRGFFTGFLALPAGLFGMEAKPITGFRLARTGSGKRGSVGTTLVFPHGVVLNGCEFADCRIFIEATGSDKVLIQQCRFEDRGRDTPMIEIAHVIDGGSGTRILRESLRDPFYTYLI